MAYVICVIAFMVAMVTSGEAKDYPWLNDNDVTVINRTDTAVVLAWHLPKEMSVKEVKNYRLFVSYRRRGYSVRTIEAQPTDPDCSLLLSHCHLRNLVPGEAYSATITIDYIGNETLLGRANLPFATLDLSSKDGDFMWWLLFVAVPAAVLILLLVALPCFARCCRCLCWRKKKTSTKKTSKTHQEGENKIEPNTASPKSSSLDRKHSLQTRQWVRDTLASIDLDPESTYDHPQTSPTTYDIPRGLNSPPPALAASGCNRNDFYMEIVDSPPSPANSEASQNRSKSASTMPSAKGKGKKLKKSKTNPNLLISSAELPAPVNSQEARLPPKPCKSKPTKDMIHKSASLPSCQQQTQLQPNLRHETPPHSPLSELQQKLQGKLQQQQQQQQRSQEEQTTLETHHYANTDDLSKLKGNARKMFPML